MAGREFTDDAGGVDADSHVEVLRSGREEARIVLDHQIQLLDGLQTKAVRTVRVTGLVFGLVLSAGTLPGASRFVNEFTLAGAGTLALTLLSGLVTYSASDPEVGVGPQQLADARTGEYDEAEWFDALVTGYEDWIMEMKELNDGNARMLTYTQVLLGIGVFLLTIGTLVEIVQ